MTELAIAPAEADVGQTVPDWDAPSRPPPTSAAPVLAVDGFEGPLDWLLELAGAQRIDLARLSIMALIEAFSRALDTALTRPFGARPDLARWGEWLVMAASLTLLRSRLLLPADAPGSQAAQEEAEALRQVLVDRSAMRRGADWLDQREQLGRDVFPRGSVGETANGRGRAGDVTDLFRACLLALRVPEPADAYQLRLPFWRVTDAVARITLLLEARPGEGRWRASCRASTRTGRSGRCAVAPHWPAPSWAGSNWPVPARSGWTSPRPGKPSRYNAPFGAESRR
jgi:segregation and condensation protein A